MDGQHYVLRSMRSLWLTILMDRPMPTISFPIDISPIVQWLRVGFNFQRIGFYNSNTYIITGNHMTKDYIRIFSYSVFGVFCPIHVVTFTLISNLVTDYIQKRRREPSLFSFEYNLLPKLISKYYCFMDQA